MKTSFICAALILICSSVFALTGFGISNRFQIRSETLPVVLSSFTATATAQNCVTLQWTTQSETNLLGYNVFRSSGPEASHATLISTLIPATNSSTQQCYSFEDRELSADGIYYYWLYSLELDGLGHYHGPVSVNLTLDDDQSTPELPATSEITNIFPNPFNPTVNISYQINSPGLVKLDIFNARGQLVNSLQENHSSGGQYTWKFNGIDRHGNSLSSGVYQVVMSFGYTKSMRKMVLVK